MATTIVIAVVTANMRTHTPISIGAVSNTIFIAGRYVIANCAMACALTPRMIQRLANMPSRQADRVSDRQLNR